MSLSTNNPVKYEMRAPPRRRIKTEEADDQPVFLRKAFVMMSSCPPEIGGWSEKGDTVVVRDVKLFAEKIIPTAYKHNNFSSFVRQLNFYGFRKIKSESLDQASWWEFRHPHFLRDQPQLLSEIKRSVHYVANETPNVHEVSDLKSQVGTLTDRIDALHEQIEMLTGAVNHIQLTSASQAESLNVYHPSGSLKSTEDFTKKRKLGPKGMQLQQHSSGLTESGEDLSGGHLMRMSSIGSALDFLEFESSPPTGMELQTMDIFSQQPVSAQKYEEEAEDSMWDASIDKLFALTSESSSQDSPKDRELYSYGRHEKSVSVSHPVAAKVYHPEEADQLPQARIVTDQDFSAAPAAAGQDLFAILESLSPDLKIRFVDKLAEVMGRQLTANMATAAVASSSLPTQKETQHSHGVDSSTSVPLGQMESSNSSGSAAQYFSQITRSNPTFNLPSGIQAPEIALPLASAALGAFVFSSLNSLLINQQQAEMSSRVIKSEIV